MNQAQQLLARGAAILAKQSAQAERVTLRGVTVDANVFRNSENLQAGSLAESSTEEKSVIEYPLGGLIPERQDIFTDSFGYKHEVQRVRHIGHALRCECEVVR
jgi:hypothetical protein